MFKRDTFNLLCCSSSVSLNSDLYHLFRKRLKKKLKIKTNSFLFMSGAGVNLSWEVIQSRWRRLTVARVQIKRPLNTRLELFMCNHDFQV